MENYVEKCQQYSEVSFKDYCNVIGYIKKYEIDKDHNQIRIYKFDGSKETFPLTQFKIMELEHNQKYELEQQKDIVSRIKYRETGALLPIYALATPFATLYSIIGFKSLSMVDIPLIQGLSIGVIGLGVLHLGVFAFPLINQIKLNKIKQELKLVSFLSDHRQEATKIIREEMEQEKVINPNCQNLTFTYPENTPYSENLYNQGLNLSTIDDLTKEQQKQLKKKIDNKKKK